MNNKEAGKLGYLKVKDKFKEQIEKKKANAIKNFEKENKHCPVCDFKISFEKRYNKFCSQSCSAIFNNASKKLLPKRKRTDCACCMGPVYKPVNKFCDECIKTNKHVRKNTSLEDCKSDQSRKKFLLKTQEHKCEVCLNTIWNSKPIPLELDHIDGNHMNNIKENLRLICPNCHAQTITYKARNKGNGRKHRRIRYEQDKKLFNN